MGRRQGRPSHLQGEGLLLKGLPLPSSLILFGWLSASYTLLLSFSCFCLFDTRSSAMADLGAHKDRENKSRIILFIQMYNVFFA